MSPKNTNTANDIDQIYSATRAEMVAIHKKYKKKLDTLFVDLETKKHARKLQKKIA